MVAPSLVMVTSPMSSTNICGSCGLPAVSKMACSFLESECGQAEAHGSLSYPRCHPSGEIAVTQVQIIAKRVAEAPHQRRTLSSPTGPRELLTMLAMAATAVTFCVRTSWPDDRSPCSCRLLAARAAILLSAAPASHRAGPAPARPSRRPPRGRSSARLMAPAAPWWPLAWWLDQSGVARKPFSCLFYVLAVFL